MMINGKRTLLVRLTSAIVSVALLALLATVAMPAIDAQEKPAQVAPAVPAEHAEHGTMEMKAEEVTKAVAVLSPASGSGVHGVITFTKAEGGVKITGRIEGLTPGTHGFHVHEFGDISAADASSAGGHFNPMHAPHAAPEAMERHEGDLGNVEADANGVANYERLDKEIQLNGPHSIIGRSVVVHGNADDLKSQPAGNAGPRVGVGVVGIAKP